jgi:hypothetical protein
MHHEMLGVGPTWAESSSSSSILYNLAPHLCLRMCETVQLVCPPGHDELDQ